MLYSQVFTKQSYGVSVFFAVTMEAEAGMTIHSQRWGQFS